MKSALQVSEVEKVAECQTVLSFFSKGSAVSIHFLPFNREKKAIEPQLSFIYIYIFASPYLQNNNHHKLLYNMPGT